MDRRAFLRTAGAVAAALPAAGCDGDAAPPLQRLTIAAGGPDDGFRPIAEALAAHARERWSIEARVVEATGPRESLELVTGGGAAVAFAPADLVAVARGGEPPFRGALPVLALANLYEDVVHAFTRVDVGVRDLPRFAGRKLGTGSPGAELVTTRLLAAGRLTVNADVQPIPLRVADAAEALAAGTVDAFVVSGDPPLAPIVAVRDRVRLRLLRLTDEVEKLRASWGGTYAERSMPMSVYDTPEGDVTVGVANLLVASAELSDAVARALTGLLFDARPALIAALPAARRIDPRTALATGPVPLHPGARRHYRETKPFA